MFIGPQINYSTADGLCNLSAVEIEMQKTVADLLTFLSSNKISNICNNAQHSEHSWQQ